MYRLTSGIDDFSNEAIEEFAQNNHQTIEEAKEFFARRKEEQDYILPLLSANIAKALTEINRKLFYQACGGTGFFRGTGSFFDTTDADIGFTIFTRKINRMIEKMRDPDRNYTFDVYEEYIFARLLDYVQGKYRDPAAKKEIKNRLHDQFGYSLKHAGRMASALIELTPMKLNDEEIDNDFFWDDDYDVCFSEYGFVKGVQMLAMLYNRGYGYDYTKEIFTDIGLNAPEELIGTEESNQKKYEAAMEERAELIEQLFTGYDDSQLLS